MYISEREMGWGEIRGVWTGIFMGSDLDLIRYLIYVLVYMD